MPPASSASQAASGSQSLIRIDGVSQRFAAGRRRPPVDALGEVTLDVHEHEFVTLVGRSGCGKSTLLRIIAGLQRPSAGSVQIAGRPVTGPPGASPAAHRITRVPAGPERGQNAPHPPAGTSAVCVARHLQRAAFAFSACR